MNWSPCISTRHYLRKDKVHITFLDAKALVDIGHRITNNSSNLVISYHVSPKTRRMY